MLGKKLINSGPISGGANTFASENFNTVLYTGNRPSTQRIGGYINRGAVFNGSSSEISIPSTDTTPIDFSTEDWSMSWWIYLDTLGDNKRIISKWGASPGVVILFRTKSDGAIEFIERDGTTSYSQSAASGTISAGQWYNMVYTRSGTEAKFYLNGSLNKTMTRTNAINQGGTEPIYIGRSSSGIDGKFDQVRFFNKALSSTEVTTLYGETFASASKSVTDIFSDSSAIALYQLDGNANDTGGVSGKFGEAAIFNGSSSIIKNTSLGTDYRGQTTLSLSAWFKTSASSGRMTIVSFSATGDGSTDLFLGLDVNTVGFRNINDGANQVQAENISGSSVRDGNWHHAVFTADSNGNKLYVDGNEITVNYDIGSSSSTIVMPSDLNQFNIGGNQDSGGNQWYWDGEIDDVRIYSDVLTSTEVGYIYNNNTASIPTDNLTAYYKLDGDARDEQQLYDGTATNVKYAYDGTATNVTYQEATNFSPDLIWIKNRDSSSYPHVLTDSVRGNTKYLQSNSSSQELTSSNGIISFDNNGFSLGNDGYFNGGASGANNKMVAWCFNAGEGAAATNNDGVTSGSVTAVTSQVKANQDAGFSICEFTTPSSGKPSWGHGLSQAPEFIIVKNAGSSGSWFIYAPLILGQKELRFTTAAATSYSPNFLSVDTSKIDLGSSSFNIGVSSRHINYNFHSVDGYQKVGSYDGTGSSEGNFVETGFEPAFIMIKGLQGDRWLIADNKRHAPVNNNAFLDAQDSHQESSLGTGNGVTFLSNGFELASNDNALNGTNRQYIYLAIAADPDTTTPTVENSFDVVTWTGDGNDRDISLDFKPDLIWVKARTADPVEGSANHSLFDSVRFGNGGYALYGNQTYAEETSTYQGAVTQYNSNGFHLGAGTNSSFPYFDVNRNGIDYVAWAWKAGDHDDNLPQINTEGTIDSIVSVNAEAGFSIVKYTGTGLAVNNTIGHGLSSAPEMIILKRLNSTNPWIVYHTAMGTGKHMELNSTGGESGTGSLFGYPADVGVAPTSTVFTVGVSSSSNASSSPFIAYCFHSVTGYQKIGSYTGNGGTLSVTTEFAPRFVILKPTSLSDNWMIYDTSRGNDIVLFPNLSNADTTYAGRFSFLSDGFQLSTSNSGWNGSGETYIYLAIK